MSQQPGPEPRIGDSEREAAVHALGEHYAAGRLTKDEYDERAATAFEARTASALWPLFADLPRPQAQQPPAATASRSPRPGPGVRSQRPGWRAGPWVVPLLAIVTALVLLTNLPLLVLLVVGALVWTKLGRHRSHRLGGRSHGCGSARYR